MSVEDLQFKEHGIQLNYVGVKEIHFDSERLPLGVRTDELGDIAITTARSEYNRETKKITVIVKVEVAAKADNLHLRIVLVAEFSVNESVFPFEKVEEWASKAAHFVVLPFMREHLVSLCIRVGLPPIGLPMYIVPTFKVESPNASPEEAVVGAV